MNEFSQALVITGTGLGIVFGVMAIIAFTTWISGKVFMALDKKKNSVKKESTSLAEDHNKSGVAS
ncbi:MAG: OadG family protein [Deltaproteobacteria bacterium]|nr:OadG family protein [Deltaproteobacteria bacterium]